MQRWISLALLASALIVRSTDACFGAFVPPASDTTSTGNGRGGSNGGSNGGNNGGGSSNVAPSDYTYDDDGAEDYGAESTVAPPAETTAPTQAAPAPTTVAGSPPPANGGGATPAPGGSTPAPGGSTPAPDYGSDYPSVPSGGSGSQPQPGGTGGQGGVGPAGGRNQWPDGGAWAPNPAQLPGGTGRSVGEAAADSDAALLKVLQNLTPGEAALLPEETLNNLPPEVLSQLPPETLASLPESVQQRLAVQTHIKATALGETLKFLPVDKLAALPWPDIIKGVPPTSLNEMTPTSLGAIPWATVMKDIPPDTMAGLAPSTLQLIPGEAWEQVTYDQLSVIKPAYLAQLPLHSLKKIPPGQLKRLGPQKLSGMSKDVLSALGLLDSVVGSQTAGNTVAEAQGLARGTIDTLGSTGSNTINRLAFLRRALAARARARARA